MGSEIPGVPLNHKPSASLPWSQRPPGAAVGHVKHGQAELLGPVCGHLGLFEGIAEVSQLCLRPWIPDDMG